MSQSKLDDDDLFGEAATEMRADVEEHLALARAELPEAEDVWSVEADNALGVLNGLRTALDVDAADEHLRDAKKWYTVGERADAFEDGEDLAAEIETIEETLSDLSEAREQVGELTGTIPQLKSALEEFEAEADDAADDAETEADADAGSEAQA